MIGIPGSGLFNPASANILGYFIYRYYYLTKKAENRKQQN